jgi:putative peptidoglycan lipid II flippase
VQIPSAINCGFKYKKIFNFKDPGIKKIFLLMVPRTLGVVGLQANLFVITAIASTLSAGSISVFNYSNNLQGLASGIIGVSFSMAVFPALSKDWVGGKREEFVKRFLSVFKQILYVIIPLSILMFLLREPAVDIILKHGVFGNFSAQLTSASLGLFCFGIFAFSLNPLLSRTFYSFKDTKTPTVIIFIAMAFNILSSIFLVSYFSSPNFLSDFLQKAFSLQGLQDIRVIVLPLSYSVSVILQSFLLFFCLKRKISEIKIKDIMSSFLKIIAAGFFMAVTMIVFANFILSADISFGFWELVFRSGIVAFLGIMVYILITFLLKSEEAKSLLGKIRNKKDE